MHEHFDLIIEPLSPDRVKKMLEENCIFINQYAEQFFTHPRFSSAQKVDISVFIASLHEIGFKSGATLDDIFKRIPSIGLRPCPPSTGVFLRLLWKDQPQSQNSILSGTHGSPDLAVTVLSEVVSRNDDFPKGLYLRNVEGNLWLRGYICDASYRFPGDALFVFEKASDPVFYNG